MHDEEAWEERGEHERRHRHGGRSRMRMAGPPGPGGPRRRGGWGPGFGPGPEMWFGRAKFMRGPRVKRGDVRAAALALLAEEPRNGYQIIQEIGERSGGVWRPSPGSVYPALQQLEDEGLIRAETPEGGRSRYALTDGGPGLYHGARGRGQRALGRGGRSVGDDAMELRALIGQVAMAAVQVTQVGCDTQMAQAHRILTDTRRSLYRILAADDDAGRGRGQVPSRSGPSPAG